MDDQVLGVLRWGMLGLLYLFFGRVMWAVWTQVRLVPATPTTPFVAALRVLEPAALAGDVDLTTGPITLGRHPDCDVSLPGDAFLSQRHLRVGRGADGVWVEDLGSTNGTSVDGRRITTRHTMRAGQRVQAGSLVLEAT